MKKNEIITGDNTDLQIDKVGRMGIFEEVFDMLRKRGYDDSTYADYNEPNIYNAEIGVKYSGIYEL